jgi:hypothetical protein
MRSDSLPAHIGIECTLQAEPPASSSEYAYLARRVGTEQARARRMVDIDALPLVPELAAEPEISVSY